MHNEPQFFLPADLVARALASLAETVHDEVDRLLAQPHQGAPDIKSERSFYLRQYRAFIKAAYHWGQGVRPVATAAGWLIPSGSRAGVVHAVERVGGVWVCGPSCEARDAFHWHTALVVGIERAIELAGAEDDGDPEPGDPADGPITFSDGTPIPDEPDAAAELACPLPTVPPWQRGRPAAPAPTPAPRLPYARPSSSWQQWRNDEAARPWRAEERARMEQHRAARQEAA